MQTFTSPTTGTRPPSAASVWMIARIGSIVLAVAAPVAGVVLAGDAFLAGVVIESTDAAEARRQVANAAFGNSLGIFILAVAALGCAITAAAARRSLRWAVVPAVLLSLAAFAVAAPVELEIGRGHCLLQTSNVTQC